MSDENNIYENNENVVEETFNEENGTSGKGQSNGLGIASMVLGILSLITICCVPYGPIVLGIIAIVLGIVQIVKNEKKGMAIAGIVCGAIGLIVYVVLLAWGSYAMSSGLYDEILRQYNMN